MVYKHHEHTSSITRRAFLARANALLGAVGVPYIWVSQKRKAFKEHEVLLGSGKHTYLWDSHFFKLPANVRFEKNTHAVAIDKQGRIYVHSQSDAAVMVFDPEGHFLTYWGGWMKPGAHGMDIREENGQEYIYFALTFLHLVVKTTLEGEEVFRLGYPKESGVYSNETLYVPTNCAFAPNGDFYVADGYGLSYIHQYTRDGKYVRTWGGLGSTAGKLNCPHGICVDVHGPKPLVVVADRANHRLQRFTLDGEFVDILDHDLRLPCHFDQHPKETVIPDLAGRVTLFDSHNQLLMHLGDNPNEGQRARNDVAHEEWVDGIFISPHDACWDSKGNLLVVEWLADGGRATMLRKLS